MASACAILGAEDSAGMSAGLVALGAPYCQENARPEELEQALETLAGGACTGVVRQLKPAG